MILYQVLLHQEFSRLEAREESSCPNGDWISKEYICHMKSSAAVSAVLSRYCSSAVCISFDPEVIFTGRKRKTTAA